MTQMASDRVSETNRKNAQSSTGPRTPHGKASSSRNARKHGLSASGHTTAEESDISRVTALIVSERGLDGDLTSAARIFAEAHIEFQRVRAYKAILYERISTSISAPPKSEETDNTIQDAFATLSRIQRYEQRAFSRRKFLARRLLEFPFSGEVD